MPDLRPESDSRAPSHAPHSPQTDAPRTTDETYQILVVDDGIDAAESMGMLLGMRGHGVRLAYNGEDAIRLAADAPPDVVLLDLGLPGMDGFEVCRRLRAQANAPMYIIAMTGYSDDDARQRTHEAGFDDHAVKPIAFAELAKLLAKSRL